MSDPTDLASHLPSPDRLALFLDIDGTLIAPTAEARARGITSDRLDLLGRLLDLVGGAAAVLTGRAIEMVDPLLAPLTMPVAGLQGADRRFADGRRLLPVQTPQERRALERVADAVDASHLDVEIEWKPGALALVLKTEDADAEGAAAIAARYAGNLLKVIAGRVAVDIVPLSASKGAALAAFMEETPFFGRVPVHVGDDLPDEAAFAAARRLGGFGISVSRRVCGVDRSLADFNATWAMLAAYETRWSR